MIPLPPVRKSRELLPAVFVEKFSKEGKVAVFSAFYNKPGMLTPAFREELYKASRIRYTH